MIVQENADTRRSRARLWNLMLGGNEAYEEDRAHLDRLRHVAPDIDRLAINETKFVERAWRFAIGLRGINQVIYCGAPLPPNHPPHTAAWEAVALRQLERVVYLEPDKLLAAKGAGYLADRTASVVRADPLDLAESVDRIDRSGEILWDEPVAVVAPGVLHWVGDDVARAWTRRLAALVAPGSYLVASHFLDPELEMDTFTVFVEQLIQAFDAVGVLSGSLAGALFRRQAAIAELFDGWELVPPGVVPAIDWWPAGPQLRPETPCDRLMAGVVATFPRSP